MTPEPAAIEVQSGARLDQLSTFRLPARANELVELHHAGQLPAALDTPLPTLIIGGGSNTLFIDDYPGRVIVNCLHGIRTESIDDDQVLVTAAGGENWHDLVLKTVDQDLWGLENLALIPGSVGAAPMQNIGAYGVELSDVLHSVQVFDRNTEAIDWIAADQCQLSYRDSRFKNADAGRFVILAVRMTLSRSPDPRIEYPALQHELASRNSSQPTHPRTIADAVIRIRQRKLPDPDRIPNAGSFFKNPVVPKAQAESLRNRYPNLQQWPVNDGVKLSAGWMIDQLGWRGKSFGGAAVYSKHALVLINKGNASGQDLRSIAKHIRQDVNQHFGVTLETEPQLIGSGKQAAQTGGQYT